ncbi:hypothetical protein AOLI_G00061980 [Acnodon oligacanthus]
MCNPFLRRQFNVGAHIVGAHGRQLDPRKTGSSAMWLFTYPQCLVYLNPQCRSRTERLNSKRVTRRHVVPPPERISAAPGPVFHTQSRKGKSVQPEPSSDEQFLWVVANSL